MAGSLFTSAVSCTTAMEAKTCKHASKENNKRLLKLPSLLHAVYKLLHICIKAIAGNGLIFTASTSREHGFPLMSGAVFMIYKELFLMLNLS